MFIVEHYAGSVRYDSRGFLEKNRDQLPEDLQGVVASSSFPFLNTLFSSAEAPLAAGARKASLGSKFAKQLSDLMTALNATEPHYIRCIKPNPVKAPIRFDGQMCLDQLQYAGVFEAVAIRKQGYPFRLLHQDFFERYKCILAEADRERTKTPENPNGTYVERNWSAKPLVEHCQDIIRQMGLVPVVAGQRPTNSDQSKEMHVGKTMILYRAEQHRSAELQRNLALEYGATQLQRHCRRLLVQKAVARCLAYRPILARAVASGDINEVNKALEGASQLGFEFYELAQARRFKFVYEETRRLKALMASVIQSYHGSGGRAQTAEQVRSVSPEQWALRDDVQGMRYVQEYYSDITTCVQACDAIELKLPEAELLRALQQVATATRDGVTRDAEEQRKILDEVEMKSILRRADDLPGYDSEPVSELRTLLFNTSLDEFVKLQLKAAYNLHDAERIQLRTIRFAELILEKNAADYAWETAKCLIPPLEWANEKTFCWDREALAASKLRWTSGSIHHPLTFLTREAAQLADDEGSIADDAMRRLKDLCNIAKRVFKTLQSYMGIRRTQEPQPELIVSVLKECIAHPELCDEVYAQIVKQLTENPHDDMRHRAWEFMVCCLHAISPTAALEYHLHQFFRTNLAKPLSTGYINLLYKRRHEGSLPAVPDPLTVMLWISRNNERDLDCDDYEARMQKAELRQKQMEQGNLETVLATLPRPAATVPEPVPVSVPTAFPTSVPAAPRTLPPMPSALPAVPTGLPSALPQTPAGELPPRPLPVLPAAPTSTPLPAAPTSTPLPAAPTSTPLPTAPASSVPEPVVAAAPASAPAPVPAVEPVSTTYPAPVDLPQPAPRAPPAIPPRIPQRPSRPTPVVPVGPPDHVLFYAVTCDNNERVGPTNKHELKALWTAGRLNGESLCWCDGMADWQPVSTQTVLYEFLKY